jgi:uncharacterized membrane protein YbaN (DUF454 family)
MQTVTASKRLIYQLAGYVFFAIGFVGMMLPLLPTTVFWIIAAACFAKSTPGMYRRIVAWPRVGPAIEAYLDDGVIGPHGKMCALTGMTFGAFVIVASPIDAYMVACSLFCLTLAATYVLTRPDEKVTLAGS